MDDEITMSLDLATPVPRHVDLMGIERDSRHAEERGICLPKVTDILSCGRQLHTSVNVLIASRTYHSGMPSPLVEAVAVWTP